jgi:hypothetical protein
LFDNDIYEDEADFPQFNLERLARNTAQQMMFAGDNRSVYFRQKTFIGDA